MNLHKVLFLAACIASCMFQSFNANAGDLEWKAFVSEEGRFSVLMPGKPTYTVKDEPTQVGLVRENLYSYDNGPLELDAEYSDLPFLAALFAKRSRIYNEIVAEFLKRVHGTEISVESITLDAYRGKLLTYETDKRYGKLWMLLISRRIYALHASVPKDFSDKLFMAFYFGSFKPVYKTVREHHRRSDD